MQFERNIYPVGHGGFAAETLDDYTVVFDCGSDVCPVRVSQFIDKLGARTAHINMLVLSHFDKDHVNCIRELISKLRIYKVVIPSIPANFHVVYNALTGGAYNAILNMFQEQGTIVEEIQDQTAFSNNGGEWEWIVKSMIDNNDWNKVIRVLQSNGLDENQLDDANYVEGHLQDIKSSFESVFGRNNSGLNAHGVLMISQKISPGVISNTMDSIVGKGTRQQYTGCFYTGDADMKVNRRMNSAKRFYDNNRRGIMLLCQLPHHGSCHNARPDFDVSFPSAYYFYQDNTDRRIRSNSGLYGRLIAQPKLIHVRDIDSDEVVNRINF